MCCKLPRLIFSRNLGMMLRFSTNVPCISVKCGCFMDGMNVLYRYSTEPLKLGNISGDG